MDAVLPPDIAGAILRDQTARARRRSVYSVRWSESELPVVELTPRGFVVEAETPPRMRGFTDIFEGDDRVMHGLAICTWARDGLVGYEFKRGTGARQIRADHAPPAHSGLLEAPE